MGQQHSVWEWAQRLSRSFLKTIDLDKDARGADRQAWKDATGQKRARIVKRLEVVEAFRESGNKPEWMILDSHPGNPAGSSSYGTAGRRTFRHHLT